ncbi:TPA: hypothetical protein QDC59_002899 [Burkholderia cenocepacia]|nr:hypothetical protein [Burkholderia cenocepacia]
MSLADLIYKKRRGGVANANHANPANGGGRSGGNLSSVSNISVSKVRQEVDGVIDRAEIPPDCVGALVDPDSGGLFLPWGSRLSADDVRRLSAELVGAIETLASMEHWPHELLDDMLGRAIRGPLADLLPNVSYFRERLEAAHAELADAARVREILCVPRASTDGVGHD